MENLWQIAHQFRNKVCTTLNEISNTDRHNLRGDYLFTIDNLPTFIVMIDERGAWSIQLFHENSLRYEVDAQCPFVVDLQSIQNCIEFTSRAKISTTSSTLEKLLLGQLKAKIAFVHGKVKIDGDLAAFLKLIALLKQNGLN